MASSVTTVMIGLGLTFLTTLPAIAADGTIRFIGSIVEEPCLVTPERSQIAVSCFDKGSMKTQQISVQQAARGNITFPGVADVSLTYENPQKTLAVVLMDYN